jgi:predicted nucleotidyltransferase
MMIARHLKEQLIHIFSSFSDVHRVILFGSRAREDYNDRSDIDLAIEAPKIEQKKWLDLTYQLEEKLDTLLSIDIVRLEKAPQELKERINKEGEVLYERTESTTKP